MTVWKQKRDWQIPKTQHFNYSFLFSHIREQQKCIFWLANELSFRSKVKIGFKEFSISFWEYAFIADLKPNLLLLDVQIYLQISNPIAFSETVLKWHASRDFRPEVRTEKDASFSCFREEMKLVSRILFENYCAKANTRKLLHLVWKRLHVEFSWNEKSTNYASTTVWIIIFEAAVSSCFDWRIPWQFQSN